MVLAIVYLDCLSVYILDFTHFTLHSPLLKALEHLPQTTSALSYAEEFDKSHSRQVRRRVWVYRAPTRLREHWSSLQSLIYVEREGWRDAQPFVESVGYISDLSLKASQFLDPSRLHWGIENRLH
ncbi:MAG: hypothetical protein ACK5YH_12195 [Pseudanabaena sp.]